MNGQMEENECKAYQLTLDKDEEKYFLFSHYVTYIFT